MVSEWISKHDSQQQITSFHQVLIMNWRDALCVAEFSDVHMFVYVNVVGETDDKLSTADMDNKNINSLLNGETKDESQIDYVNDKPLTEENDCESPAAESDDKSSTAWIHR